MLIKILDLEKEMYRYLYKMLGCVIMFSCLLIVFMC